MIPMRIKIIGVGTIITGTIASVLALYTWWKTGMLFVEPPPWEMALHVSFFTGYLYMMCWATDTDGAQYLCWMPGHRGILFWIVAIWIGFWIVSGVSNLLSYIV